MTIREDFEKREKIFIAPYGSLSTASRGRRDQEERCPIRTAYQVDRDRIVYSTAFRRLKHKTQVFLSPLGAVYRTRLTHTLEVAQIARTIARALRLNEDLTEAIALGHDLGHTPFGHGGETALKELFSNDFSHHEQSLRVVEVLENNGRGLNLTHEVRDGIVKHSKGYGKIIPDEPREHACTVEGMIVRISDIMAYLNHDLDDAIRSGVITIDRVPETCLNVMGSTHSKRAISMIRDVVYNCTRQGDKLCLGMSDEMTDAMALLREFLYENVYRAPKVHNEFIKAKKILIELYGLFMDHNNLLEQELAEMNMSQCNHTDQPKERIVCDLIASMTDRGALELYKKNFFPSPLV